MSGDEDRLEKYIEELPWSDAVTEDEKGLVNRNLRIFYRWLLPVLGEEIKTKAHTEGFRQGAEWQREKDDHEATEQARREGFRKALENIRALLEEEEGGQ